MAHELTPEADNPPVPVDEIIRRLRDSFAHLQVDVEHASRELEESARIWPALAARLSERKTSTACGD